MAKHSSKLKSEKRKNEAGTTENSTPVTNTSIETKEISARAKIIINVLVTIYCVLIYIIPMRSSEAPVLDELFILDTRGEESTNPNLLHNGDVMGTTTMQELFQNDYWGKNIFQMDSHKSWRPVCVLTFRIFNSLSESKGIFRGLEEILPISTMFTHRYVLHYFR